MKNYPEDIPWKDVLIEAIPLLAILVFYFAIQLAISAPAIFADDGRAGAPRTPLSAPGSQEVAR